MALKKRKYGESRKNLFNIKTSVCVIHSVYRVYFHSVNFFFLIFFLSNFHCVN